MKLLRRIDPGNLAPWGWGLAWRDVSRRENVLAPMPFNLLVRIFWWLYWGVAYRWIGRTRKDRMISEAVAVEAKSWRHVSMQRDVAFEMLRQASGLSHGGLIRRIEESLP